MGSWFGAGVGAGVGDGVRVGVGSGVRIIIGVRLEREVARLVDVGGRVPGLLVVLTGRASLQGRCEMSTCGAPEYVRGRFRGVLR